MASGAGLSGRPGGGRCVSSRAAVRVLYVAMRHDYGDPRRGLSFEETNFRSALEGMGHEVLAFDFMERARRDGVARMRSDLIEEARRMAPDVAFFCLFTDQLGVATLQSVRRTGCPTVNWFGDDHWRFETFTRHMAPALDRAVTTDADSLPRYAEPPTCACTSPSARATATPTIGRPPICPTR
jgi:spore maturation protein CgeB